MTLGFRKLPQNSSGKWRLVRKVLPAEGRAGRSQTVFMRGCFPGWSIRPLKAGPK